MAEDVLQNPLGAIADATPNPYFSVEIFGDPGILDYTWEGLGDDAQKEITTIRDRIKQTGLPDRITFITRSKDLALRFLRIDPARRYELAFWIRHLAKLNGGILTLTKGKQEVIATLVEGSGAIHVA